MERKGTALIFAAGILWGTIGFFIRMMTESGASSQLISFVRMGFAFLVMLVITVVKFGGGALRIGKKALFQCLLLGVVCHGLYNICYSYAVAQLGMTVSCVLMNTAPVFTAVMSLALFRERITPFKWAALLVNILGCVLAATGGELDAAKLSAAGILCGAASGFCYGMTAIFGKNAAQQENAYVVSTYSYLFAALFVGIFVFPFGGAGSLNAGVLGWGFLLALIPTGIAYILYYSGLKLIKETSRVPVIASGETIVAAIIGIAFFREPLGVANIAGIALVIGSIVMMSFSGSKREHSAR